jgi:hypothetical protein
MTWWRSKKHRGATGGRLTWSLTSTDDGGARITMTLRERIPGSEHPHLSAFALTTPYGGELPEGWAVSRSYRADRDEHLDQVEVLGHFLIPPIRNLVAGQTVTTDIPVPVDGVQAVVFASLTNRIWFETGQDHLWLTNHERTPRMDDWTTQVGTDPLVHRSRLVVADGTLGLEPLVTARLSELRSDGADEEGPT